MAEYYAFTDNPLKAEILLRSSLETAQSLLLEAAAPEQEREARRNVAEHPA